MIVRHLTLGDLKKVSAEYLSAEQQQMLAMNSESYAIETPEGELVAICGMSLPWPGVGQIWAKVNGGAKGHGLSLTKTVRKLIDVTAKKHQVHRVHSFVHADNVEDIRWSQLLGLMVEGVMRKATPAKEDLLVFCKFY